MYIFLGSLGIVVILIGVWAMFSGEEIAIVFAIFGAIPLVLGFWILPDQSHSEKVNTAAITKDLEAEGYQFSNVDYNGKLVELVYPNCRFIVSVAKFGRTWYPVTSKTVLSQGVKLQTQVIVPKKVSC